MLTWAVRRLAVLVTALVFAGLPASAAAQGLHPRAVVEAYVAAVNANQLETVMAFYADGVPEKDALRSAFRNDFAGRSFRMEAVAYRVSGNRVTWEWRVNYDPYHELHVPPLAGTTTVLVVDGRFHAVRDRLDPAAVQRRQAAIRTLTAAPASPVAEPVSPPNTQGRTAPSVAVWAAAALFCLVGGISVAAQALKRPEEDG